MMKIAKHACLALAGIGFFSCSNEEIVQPEVEAPVAVNGNASLTLRIENPGMENGNRNIKPPTEKGTKAISVNSITVKYLPGGTYQKVDNVTEQIETGKIILYDVPKGTTGIEIVGNSSVNAGGESFKSTSKTETEKEEPVSNTTVYGVDLKLEADGTIPGDGNGTTYSNYKAEVTLRPVTARIELSGLKFNPNDETTEKKKTSFSQLHLLGVFMNGHYVNGAFAPEGSGDAAIGKVTSSGEKRYKSNPTTSSGGSGSPTVDDFITAIKANTELYDGFTNSTGELFFQAKNGSDITEDQTPTFPSGSQVYGYNFFVKALGSGETVETDPGDDGYSLPKFTVALAPTYASDATITKATVLYAVVSTYKIKGDKEIKRFAPGKIYKVKDLELPEDNLTPDPSGKDVAAITAIVEVEDWEIEDTNIDWEGGN